MSKPEDVTQEAWGAGHAKAIDYLNWLGAVIKSNDEYVLSQVIARAIMAAKAEEREACISTANAERVLPLYVNPENAVEEDKVYDMAIDHVTDAIRSRT